jgi:hypothetical protein
MPGPNVQETFTTSSSPASVGNASDVLCVPTGVTTMRLTTVGLDASNTVKTQKRTAGGAFADQVTYNSEQTNTAITVASGEEWRLVQVTQQAIKDVRYKLSCES